MAAGAQPYPSKPVRVIVPFPPGGTADLLTRLTAEKLTASFGQQLVVENRAGAGGNLAAEDVGRAEPDGYKLIAAARARPGALAIASQGNGTSSHLSAELFKSMAGIELLHVPYKGTAPAMSDLLGAQVELLFDNLITAMPHVKSGKLRLLGVGSERRVAAFPDVPAITELLPGFRSETWMALVAPPGTPTAIAERLSAAVGRAVREPDFKRFLTELQAEPVGNTPAEMAAVIRQDTERWSRVIRDAHISIQ